MSNYPLIKKYLSELELKQGLTAQNFILASDLEEALQKATVLKGCFQAKKKGFVNNWAFDSSYDDETTTHECLALGIQPIEKPLEPVDKEELISILKYNTLDSSHAEMQIIIERIKQAGVK